MYIWCWKFKYFFFIIYYWFSGLVFWVWYVSTKVRGEGSALIVFCHYLSCHYFHKGGEGRANLTNVTNFMGFIWLPLAAFSLKSTSQEDKIDNLFGELKQKFCLSFLPLSLSVKKHWNWRAFITSKIATKFPFLGSNPNIIELWAMAQTPILLDFEPWLKPPYF